MSQETKRTIFCGYRRNLSSHATLTIENSSITRSITAKKQLIVFVLECSFSYPAACPTFIYFGCLLVYNRSLVAREFQTEKTSFLAVFSRQGRCLHVRRSSWFDKHLEFLVDYFTLKAKQCNKQVPRQISLKGCAYFNRMFICTRIKNNKQILYMGNVCTILS